MISMMEGYITMKTLRYVVLLSLTIVLLASCGPLPPLSPPQAPPAAVSTGAVTRPAVAPTEIATAASAVPVTAATETPGAPAAPVMGADPLSGVVWEWSAFLMTSPPTQAMVPDPAAHLSFDGGTVLIKADCNVGRYAYTLENEI
jgi:hypothetical protein